MEFQKAETRPAHKILTPWYHALPPAPRHSVTTHLPGWKNNLRFVDRDPELMRSFVSMYPRMMPKKDVKELTGKLMEMAGIKDKMCILFVSPEAVKECIGFATSPKRGANTLSPDEITTRIFDAQIRFYAIFFPPAKAPGVMPFWVHTGTGLSSRLAEETLKNHLDILHEVTNSTPPPKLEEAPAHQLLRTRIASLLERAPIGSARAAKVLPEDVYLFQTGMTSIHYVHQYLLSAYASPSAFFGFAFHSSPVVLEYFGPGRTFYGNGHAEDLVSLSEYLKSETKEGRKIQALWTEFPANPILRTPDLKRLRQLADEYGFFLIVDDTVGGFCNVDVMGVADVVVTSLTKSFSGYADVMGGSAVLNSNSKRYPELKSLFDKTYRNDMYGGDAEALMKNSEDYLERSKVLNGNALALVNYLQALTKDPKSSVKAVYYPTTSTSLDNYLPFKRPETEEFKPGYGCLFSVELDKVEATIAFFDNLSVHHGPHLGAHLTLAMPYTRGLYANELDWAAGFGLLPTQIRISVGLEKTEDLIETFAEALVAADAVKGESEKTLVSST